MGFKTLTENEMREIKQYTDDDTNWSNMPAEFSDIIRRGIAAGLVNDSAFAWFDDKCWYKGSTIKVFTDLGDQILKEGRKPEPEPQQPNPTIINYHMNGPGARVNNNSIDNSINDNSTQGRLLVTLSNSELLAERVHRSSILKKERRRKLNLLGILWAAILVVAGATSVYLFLSGQEAVSGLVLGLFGLAGSIGTLQFYIKPTEFETRQINALNEIKMLLRDRDVE